MNSPPPLKPGDSVALVAPARKVSKEEISASIAVLESWGYKVHCGKHLFGESNQYSGNDAERLHDLQWALDDDSISAVFCARGGYGTLRIIDDIDFTRFSKHPKWIVGYSDITVLHSHINSVCAVETLHAAMPINFPRHKPADATLSSLNDALMGKPIRYIFPSHPLDRPGSATGEVVGGNLSILYSLNGSGSFPDTSGKLLFIEDLDEYLYHIDRMMQNLKRSGSLFGLKGLLVGRMTAMRDNEIPFGKEAVEIVMDAVGQFNYPVACSVEAGHGPVNMALIMGRTASLQVGSRTVLEFSHP